MIAIVLAAGSGRRMGPKGTDIPKCLLEFGGRTLLARHVAALDACGVRRLCVVVGFHSALVCAHLEKLRRPGFEIEICRNEMYRRGSVVSLMKALDSLPGDEDLLIMDADVIYPRELLRRLLASDRPSSFLLDPRSVASGEEMILGVRQGLVRCIRRQVDPARYELLGESVGFLRVARTDVGALSSFVRAVIEEGRLNDEYESAYDRFVREHEVGFVGVDDLPWTELDFPEDVALAEREILPLVNALDGGHFAPPGG